MSSLLPRLRRLLAAFLILGSLWFVASDRLLTGKFNPAALAVSLSFLGIAAAALFFLLRRDVQKREQNTAKINEARQTFEIIAHSAPAGIFRANSQGDFIFVNNRWCALTGRSQAESQGFGWLLAVHPDDNKRVTEEWRKCVRGEKEFRLEFRVRNKDGSLRWVAGHATRLLDEHDQITGIIGSILDIHERKTVEDARLTEQSSTLDSALAKLQQEASYRKEMGAELERRADELKKRDTELESANRQLWTELSGREQVEAELAKTREAMEKMVSERTSTLTDVITGLEAAVAEHEATERQLREEKAKLQTRGGGSSAEVDGLRHQLQEEQARRQQAEAMVKQVREDFSLLQAAGGTLGAAEETLRTRLQAEHEHVVRLENEMVELRVALLAEHEKAERADAERSLSEEAMLQSNSSIQQRLMQLDAELEQAKEQLAVEILRREQAEAGESSEELTRDLLARVATLTEAQVKLEQALAGRQATEQALRDERTQLGEQLEQAAAGSSALEEQLAEMRRAQVSRGTAQAEFEQRLG